MGLPTLRPSTLRAWPRLERPRWIWKGLERKKEGKRARESCRKKDLKGEMLGNSYYLSAENWVSASMLGGHICVGFCQDGLRKIGYVGQICVN